MTTQTQESWPMALAITMYMESINPKKIYGYVHAALKSPFSYGDDKKRLIKNGKLVPQLANSDKFVRCFIAAEYIYNYPNAAILCLGKLIDRATPIFNFALQNSLPVLCFEKNDQSMAYALGVGWTKNGRNPGFSVTQWLAHFCQGNSTVSANAIDEEQKVEKMMKLLDQHVEERLTAIAKTPQQIIDAYTNLSRYYSHRIHPKIPTMEFDDLTPSTTRTVTRLLMERSDASSHIARELSKYTFYVFTCFKFFIPHGLTKTSMDKTIEDLSSMVDNNLPLFFDHSYDFDMWHVPKSPSYTQEDEELTQKADEDEEKEESREDRPLKRAREEDNNVDNPIVI